MTVQAAERMWSRDSSSLSTDDGKNKTLTISEGYSVVADPTDKTLDVYSAPDLPFVDDLYPGTLGIYCKKKTPRRISPIYWIVHVEWEGEIGNGGLQDHPVNKPPILSWGHVEEEIEIDEDVNGNPIATAAGERYQGVTKKVHDITLNVKRNYWTIDIPATHAYLHSVNGDTFAGFEPGLGRMTAFDATEKFDQNKSGYYEVSATIQFRYPYRTTPARAWWRRILHEGYYVRTAGVDDPPTRAVRQGSPVVQPVLLNSAGYLLPDGDDPVWKEFEIYHPLPYQALGLL